MRQNECLISKIGLDRAENELRKGLKKGTLLKTADGDSRRGAPVAAVDPCVLRNFVTFLLLNSTLIPPRCGPQTFADAYRPLPVGS